MPRMKRYALYILLILFCILTIILIRHLVHPNKMNDRAYLHQVYPLLPNTITPSEKITLLGQLQFYYSPSPKSISPASSLKIPIAQQLEVGAAYCLSWMTSCGNIAQGSFFLNRYHTQHAQQVPTPLTTQSLHYLEVIHYGWYREPGIYFYAAPGTGIFLKLGRSLIVANKIEAAKKLGIPAMDLLKIITSYVTAYPKFQRMLTYDTVKQYAVQHHTSIKKSWGTILKLSTTTYRYNRIADSRSYDMALYLACRKQHYATIQFTTQPNDNGGWGYEIMDCRASMDKPLLARWKQQQRYLSLRNPLQLSRAKHASCAYRLTTI